jgi:hypothetical protein
MTTVAALWLRSAFAASNLYGFTLSAIDGKTTPSSRFRQLKQQPQ